MLLQAIPTTEIAVDGGIDYQMILFVHKNLSPVAIPQHVDLIDTLVDNESPLFKLFEKRFVLNFERNRIVQQFFDYLALCGRNCKQFTRHTVEENDFIFVFDLIIIIACFIHNSEF